MVGIVVAGGTTELSGELASLKRVELFGETVNEDFYLLTQTCRGGWLAVGLGKHRNILPLLSVCLQLVDEFLNHRIIDVMDGVLKHERETGVVDIL